MARHGDGDEEHGHGAHDHGEHEHGHGEHGPGDHEHEHECTFECELEEPEQVREAEIVATVFAEDGGRVAEFRRGEDGGRAKLPDRLLGTMLTVAFRPRHPSGRPAVLDELLERGLPVLRIPFDRPDRPLELGPVKIDPRHLRSSYCRVRGRVIRRVRLANGTTIERPLKRTRRPAAGPNRAAP